MHQMDERRGGRNFCGRAESDLIISDIMMPKVDRLELCRRIQAQRTDIAYSGYPVDSPQWRRGKNQRLCSWGLIPIYPNLSALMCYWCVSSSLSSSRRAGRKNSRKTLRVNPSRITIASIDEQLLQKALKLMRRTY